MGTAITKANIYKNCKEVKPLVKENEKTLDRK